MPFCVLSLLMCGCLSNRATVNTKYDVAKIRRISVHPFDGAGGTAAADEFVRQLVGSGVEVTDAQHSGDVTLSGTVTEYKPTSKLIVFLGKTTVSASGGQALVVTNPLVTLGGAQVTPEGQAIGVPNAQVVSVSATVAVVARLSDATHGHVVWSDTYSYEGVDTTSALEAVVGSLLQSMGRVVPRVLPRKS